MDVFSFGTAMRTFLPRLMATFKGKPRYRPDGFDCWGHKDIEGKHIPLQRVSEIVIEDL